MSSVYRSPKRIIRSPSREPSPFGESHPMEFPLNMHPTLTNQKLEEKKDQIWKEYSEAYKNRNKKCAEHETLDKTYKKELQKHETDLASLKVQGEEYQKHRSAFIMSRDAEIRSFNCGMVDGNFQFGELTDGTEFMPEYNMHNLGNVQAESRVLSGMYRDHAKNVIDTAILKKDVDEWKGKKDAALKELVDAQEIYKKAYKNLKSLTEQCYSNIFDGMEGSLDDHHSAAKRRRKSTHQERDDKRQSDAPSTSTSTPAKNEGASGNLTPTKESGRRRRSSAVLSFI